MRDVLLEGLPPDVARGFQCHYVLLEQGDVLEVDEEDNVDGVILGLDLL